MARDVRAALHELAAVLVNLEAVLAATLDPAVTMLAEALIEDKKVLFCGNGGSAAMANHLAAELVVRFVADRRAHPGMSLAADNAVLTAAGNDFGYDRVFSRQVDAYGRTGDVLVALSTSGKSRNVLEAIAWAKHRGLRTLGLCGPTPMACDVDICVPSTVTARVQECHLLIGHLLIEGLEARVPA